MDVSESTEMYLLTTALLEEAGRLVPVPQLADELGISPVSVNQMCRKLQDQGLLEYVPYKGVTLTESGQSLANNVIRRRRLWEVFLVEQLELGLTSAEEAACRFEHITSDAIADRLSTLLGHPAKCPHGHPIPVGSGASASRALRTLDSVAAGSSCRVVNVRGDDAVRGFLQARGIVASVDVTVHAVSEDGPMLVATGRGRLSISRTVASGVEVELPHPPEPPGNV